MWRQDNSYADVNSLLHRGLSRRRAGRRAGRSRRRKREGGALNRSRRSLSRRRGLLLRFVNDSSGLARTVFHKMLL